MNRAALEAALEGGYIEQLNFDVFNNTLSLKIEVLDNGNLSIYDVLFERLGYVEYTAEPSWTGSDRRLQVTELNLESAPEHSSSEEWQVTINMWDNSYLTVRCSVIRIDGETLR